MFYFLHYCNKTPTYFTVDFFLDSYFDRSRLTCDQIIVKDGVSTLLGNKQEL